MSHTDDSSRPSVSNLGVDDLLVIYSSKEVGQAVRSLANRIVLEMAVEAEDLTKSLIIVPILAGGMTFASDLMRHLPSTMPTKVMPVHARRLVSGQVYVSATIPIQFFRMGIAHQRTVCVDMVYNTGKTARAVIAFLTSAGCGPLLNCNLCFKNGVLNQIAPDERTITALSVPNKFLVGYGLDNGPSGNLRHLPWIGTPK